MSGIIRNPPSISGGLFASYLRKILSSSIELLFPPQCAGCNRIDTYWCESCQRELERAPIIPKITYLQELDVASTNLHIGKLRAAVHALKYENAQSLAETLGKRLTQRLDMLDWTIDIVVPVPLHQLRQQERGYNQSELLSRVVCSHLQTPYHPEAIHRWKNTRAQVDLNSKDRFDNVKDAFRADPPSCAQNMSVLIIDDVLTTGATMSACARSLIMAGARKVYGLTVTSAN